MTGNNPPHNARTKTPTDGNGPATETKPEVSPGAGTDAGAGEVGAPPEVLPEARPTVRPRPTSMHPRELGFTPRRPVPWLAPLLLLSTGLRTLLATLFGAYLDKRELQNALPSDLHHQRGTGGDLWLDYVADLGDGFNATYSVAYLLAQPELVVEGTALPRGQVLLMGGDQVYPTANMEEYQDRCKGPYMSALPCAPEHGPRPTLYAVPGNHDWYDGLTAFLRLFVRVRSDNIGGWRIEQSRSYFAVELAANWWLYAIDEQSGSYLDDPQLLYFEKAAKQLRPHHRVILAVPAPTWVKAVDQPRVYGPIDYFLRTVIGPTGAQVKLILSGDLHHYARYYSEDRQLITAGGGGAYLYPTHKLPEQISVPPRDAVTRKATPSREYTLAGRYPSAARSRAYGWGVFARMPWRNPGFITLLGGVHTLLMLAMAGVVMARNDGSAQRLFSIPLAALVVLTLAGTVTFAKPPSAGGKRHVRHALLGLIHGLAHVGLAVAGTRIWLDLPFVDWPWPMPAVAAAVIYLPVAGLAAGQLLALYLLVAGAFAVNLNELYAGQGIDDAKSFLRMHIARDGTLTIYPIAVDAVGRKWRPNPGGAADTPWLEPVDPLRTRLAEEPVVIRP